MPVSTVQDIRSAFNRVAALDDSCIDMDISTIEAAIDELETLREKVKTLEAQDTKPEAKQMKRYHVVGKLRIHTSAGYGEYDVDTNVEADSKEDATMKASKQRLHICSETVNAFWISIPEVDEVAN